MHFATGGSNPDLRVDSQAMLDLFARPDLLETQTKEQIRAMFSSSKYERKNMLNVSMCWGRKISTEYENAPDRALILTRDNNLVLLAVGTSGYSCTEFLKISEDQTREKISAGVLKAHKEICAYGVYKDGVSVGSRAKQLFQEFELTL